MCGLAGFTAEIGLKEKSELLKKMVQAMRHRGPDQQGYYQDEKIFLGACRLSIIDLAGGAQPMQSEGGSIQLVYNGEIYNFKELQQELISQGHIFKSHSDTEVILHAYEEYGYSCLEKLRGMFAFALWDKRKEELFLARDRLGIKPLYYAHLNGQLIFASEIKAILQIETVKREIDLLALDQYLSFLWVPDPRTILKGIYKLPAGHYLIYKDKKIITRQYWDLRFRESELSEKEWQERIFNKFTEVIPRHLISDVPLGLFLSGGLDSSAVLALMSKSIKEKMTAYTTAFRKEDIKSIEVEDDLRYAKLAAQAFGAEHIVMTITPDIVRLLPKVVYHLDEPVGDIAAVTAYLISQAASSRFKVLLSGMGGDEVFAGYSWDLGAKLLGIYKKIPAPLNSIFNSCLNFLPEHPSHFLLRRMKKLISAANTPECILGLRTFFKSQQKETLYTPDLISQLKDADPYAQHLGYLNKVRDKDLLTQMLYLDIKTFLPGINLTYTDKMSMANSIEVRVPFLDHELVELAATLPSRLKIRGLQQKYIYKQALRNLLPAAIIKRRKAGFGAPLWAWLSDLEPLIADLLSQETVKKRGYFNYSFIHRLKENGRQNWIHIWQLLILEMWQRTFLDD